MHTMSRVVLRSLTLLILSLISNNSLADLLQEDAIFKSKSTIVTSKSTKENSQSKIFQDLAELEALTREIEQKTISLRKEIEQSSQYDNRVQITFRMADDLKEKLDELDVYVDDTKIFNTDFRTVLWRSSNLEILYSGPLPPGKRKIAARVHINDDNDKNVTYSTENRQILAEKEIDVPFGEYKSKVELVLKKTAKEGKTELLIELKEHSVK